MHGGATPGGASAEEEAAGGVGVDEGVEVRGELLFGVGGVVEFVGGDGEGGLSFCGPVIEGCEAVGGEVGFEGCELGCEGLGGWWGGGGGGGEGWDAGGGGESALFGFRCGERFCDVLRTGVSWWIPGGVCGGPRGVRFSSRR